MYRKVGRVMSGDTHPLAPSAFCRACGASIPHRCGEGRCDKCLHHLPPLELVELLTRTRAAGEAREAALRHELELANLHASLYGEAVAEWRPIVERVDTAEAALVTLREDRDYWKEKANSFG